MSPLYVTKVCPESRVFREDGQRLKEAILAHWGDGGVLHVDFEHETVASLSFLDEAIATLFLDYDAELIRSRLRPVNMVEGDRALLNRMIASRRSQRDAA